MSEMQSRLRGNSGGAALMEIYVSHTGKEYVCVVRLHDAIAGETKLANVSRLLG